MTDHQEVVQARDSFCHEERVIRRGETFHAAHPVVRAHPELFEPFQVDNPVKTATAAPGAKRS